jgi:hypothetical protein
LQSEAQIQTFSTSSSSSLQLVSSPPLFGTFYLASQLDENGNPISPPFPMDIYSGAEPVAVIDASESL